MSYRALRDIFYLSTNSGEEVFVKSGGVFDDMNKVSVKHELEHGSIEEVKEDDGSVSDAR